MLHYKTKYNIDHLLQPHNQSVLGPIQDDEALLLFALIRVLRLRNIIELGFGDGYSASNFLRAIDSNGHVVSVDVNPFNKLADNHTALINSAADVIATDIPFKHADLVFFDCHNYDAQMIFYDKMLSCNVITDDTLIALHDTGLHPFQIIPCYEIEEGWVHQPVERRMVNTFKDRGWDAICLNTKKSVHNDALPFRHGITVMQKFKRLVV